LHLASLASKLDPIGRIAMFGRQQFQPREFIPRHVHASGYVAILLAGRYEEAGDAGLVRTRPGSVIVHGAYDGHLDRIGAGGAEILNLPLPSSFDEPFVLAKHDNPDLLAQLAERDAHEAFAALIASAIPDNEANDEWPHALALDLRRDPRIELGSWCRRIGLRHETVSRRFRTIFGISPKAFRAHARARKAREMIVRDCAPLADIACHCGFADQAHMTRKIKTFTGATPKTLQRAVK
jgi:AraC-like DNA-binding protein